MIFWGVKFGKMIVGVGGNFLNLVFLDLKVEVRLILLEISR